MLQVNTTIHSGSYTSNPILSGQAVVSRYESDMYQQLAALSQRKQWILFTAQCPRPVYAELSQYEINCSNIIHMKPSAVSTEEEIVIKAIKARTASAIVASGQLNYTAKARIQKCAATSNCQVFFLNNGPGLAGSICH
ncbi:hypothetical protein L3Q72_06495 [Vibrio sp. JC009]|uniref:hypothetical protein n=1 Tax=Vibrio sp. JC009 TaxID=2912314 RepID=UPI0023B04859|nr:hypothetical protein [Vibrio sp. JC009]WED23038.1 hypothetical protein L3Q72_06495 [Vibrio sp. JC009]